MADVTNVKILGSWASPFAMRSCIALNLKNIPYEYLQQDMENKSELLLRSNPIHKKIPVLLHNGKPICESLNIILDIDECFSGPSILPSDPYEQSVARFWGAYIDDKWFGFLCGVETSKTDEEKKAAVEGVREGVKLLEKAYQEIGKGKDFFGGDTLGFIDIAFGSCLEWIKVVDKVVEKLNGFKILNETDTPGLYKWADRFCAHEAVKNVMPETEKLAGYVKILFEKMRAAPTSH